MARGGARCDDCGVLYSARRSVYMHSAGAAYTIVSADALTWYIAALLLLHVNTGCSYYMLLAEHTRAWVLLLLILDVP